MKQIAHLITSALADPPGTPTGLWLIESTGFTRQEEKLHTERN